MDEKYVRRHEYDSPIPYRTQTTTTQRGGFAGLVRENVWPFTALTDNNAPVTKRSDVPWRDTSDEQKLRETWGEEWNRQLDFSNPDVREYLAYQVRHPSRRNDAGNLNPTCPKLR